MDECFLSVGKGVENLLETNDVVILKYMLHKVAHSFVLVEFVAELRQTWKHEHVLSQQPYVLSFDHFCLELRSFGVLN